MRASLACLLGMAALWGLAAPARSRAAVVRRRAHLRDAGARGRAGRHPALHQPGPARSARPRGDAWNGVEDWPENPDADFGASPNLFTGSDGQALVGQGEKSGLYWALDRATMEPVWSRLTGPGSFTGGIIGSTAFDGERIYGSNTLTAEIFSLDRGGGLAWLSTDAVPARFNAVSVANGVVYASDLSGTLTARHAATGAVLAKLPLGAPAWGGVSIAGGSVFAATGTGSSTGYVVAYRPRG